MTLRSCGAVVFRRQARTVEYLTIESRSARRYWGLAKGTVEDGETETARREIEEEVGYSVGSRGEKRVVYFLGDAGDRSVRMQMEEVADHRGLCLAEVRELLTFEDAREVVDRAAAFVARSPT